MGIQEAPKEDAMRRSVSESAINKALSRIEVKTGLTPLLYLANEMVFLRLRKDTEELIKGLFEVEKVLERVSLEDVVSVLEAFRRSGLDQKFFRKYLRFLAI